MKAIHFTIISFFFAAIAAQAADNMKAMKKG